MQYRVNGMYGNDNIFEQKTDVIEKDLNIIVLKKGQKLYKGVRSVYTDQ